MDLASFRSVLGISDPGAAMHAMASRLYPFCRSITGSGVRETLAAVEELIPLKRSEVPTGTQVLDWTVPREWNIRDAWVKDPKGRKVVDFAKSNLHVVGYSVPVKARMPLSELRPRLFSLPDRPDWIPYRNSFYKEDWGFCLAHKDLQALEDGEYEVCIDSTLADGNLSYGEVILPGTSKEEFLISCHVCHPSLANDNLAGISVAAHLARYLSKVPHRLTYRMVFLPVTIGSITWLARNENDLGRIKGGLVLSLLGDAGRSTYKKSRRGDAAVDRAAAHVLKTSGADFEVQDFFPYGYDERQYCSPGFDLPVGCLMRTPHGKYPQYHTSGDDLSFIKAASLEDSLAKVLSILDVLENDKAYVNLSPKGEPQLGRRGLYRAMADRTDGGWNEMAMLWALNMSDGAHGLLDIAERASLPFRGVKAAAEALASHGLLAEKKASTGGES